MKEKGFLVGESLRFGWNQFKKHALFFILMMLLMIGVTLIPLAVGAFFQVQPNTLGSFFIHLCEWVIGVIFSMGFVKSALLCSAQESPTFAKFFESLRHFFSFVIAQIIYTILVYFGFLFFLLPQPWGIILGSILVIFPGIWFALRYLLYPYFVIDRGEGPIQALQSSGHVTKGAKWDLLGFWFVSLILVLLGTIAVLLGLFVALPVLWIAYAHIYRVLVAETEEPVR